MNLKQVFELHGDNFTKAVEEQLILLANENPDFVYNTSGVSANCNYHKGAHRHVTDANCVVQSIEPAGPECSGCIFGQALTRLGWDNDAEKRVGQTIDLVIRGATGLDIIPVSWVQVQASQDGGVPWGEAVKYITPQQAMEG